MDVSFQAEMAKESIRMAMEFVEAAARAAASPSAIYRPHLSADGDKWCALLGDDLMSGVAGFGDTPAEAMAAFDKAWLTERTPHALFLARAARGDLPPAQPASPPAMDALLREALDYEKGAFEADDEVNGGDVIEWFSGWRERVKLAMGEG